MQSNKNLNAQNPHFKSKLKEFKNRIIVILELFTKNVQGSNQKYLGNQKWITARLAHCRAQLWETVL